MRQRQAINETWGSEEGLAIGDRGSGPSNGMRCAALVAVHCDIEHLSRFSGLCLAMGGSPQ